jgi:hypothetical protein
VTHRLDIQRTRQAVTFEFQGHLDPAAFEELRAGVERAASGGVAVRVLLREGTEVERACVAGLRALGAELVAESAYLARWIGGSSAR